MDHNPYLDPQRRPESAFGPAKGGIDTPGEVPNIVWQTRSATPTPFENQLGDALEKVFLSGAVSLTEVVAKLDELGMAAPDGSPWTEESFQNEMNRLASK